MLSWMGLVALSAPVLADIVAEYDFTNYAGNEASAPAAFVDSNVSASVLERGTGLNASTLADSFAAKHWSGPGANDYFSFSITPDAGWVVDLKSIDLGVITNVNRPADFFQLRSSLDNFATVLGSVPMFAMATSQTITFGSSLLFGEKVEFRLTATGLNDNGHFAAVTSANSTPGIVLNGSVSPAAVPEPGSIVLLTLTGVATLGAGAYRRRRKPTA